jgi:hypothetical protein
VTIFSSSRRQIKSNQIGQMSSMYQIGELVSYHLCWVNPLDEDGAVGSDAMAKFWKGHFIVVRCARRRSGCQNANRHISRTIIWLSGLTFLYGTHLLVVMIGAKASGDVVGFKICTEVARYPLNSMDFIEFNG